MNAVRSLIVTCVFVACAAACREADTVLAVTVVGNQSDLRQLDVEVTVRDVRRTFAVPPEPRPISLPETFTVRMDRGYDGELLIRVAALDARAVRVAEGEEQLPSFRVGAVTGVEVRLRDVDVAKPDAGTTDAATSPVDAGTRTDAPVRDDAATDAATDAGIDRQDATADAPGADVAG